MCPASVSLSSNIASKASFVEKDLHIGHSHSKKHHQKLPFLWKHLHELHGLKTIVRKYGFLVLFDLPLCQVKYYLQKDS